jgi:ABC-type uncharacterized transport system ATPase subunit
MSQTEPRLEDLVGASYSLDKKYCNTLVLDDMDIVLIDQKTGRIVEPDKTEVIRKRKKTVIQKTYCSEDSDMLKRIDSVIIRKDGYVQLSISNKEIKEQLSQLLKGKNVTREDRDKWFKLLSTYYELYLKLSGGNEKA